MCFGEGAFLPVPGMRPGDPKRLAGLLVLGNTRERVVPALLAKASEGTYQESARKTV